MDKVFVKLLTPTAVAPYRGTCGVAGYDLFADVTITIPACSRALVNTGVQMAIPTHFTGIIKSRSSMAFKHSLDAGTGVIDSAYRGEVRVLLHNTSEKEHVIHKGDQIAQMLIVPVPELDLVVVNDLSAIARDTWGFGSTGK
jgi:dUTP pyrophosphatase